MDEISQPLDLSKLHDAFIMLEKRSEHFSQEKLMSAFVDTPPLLTALGTKQHQVIYGRRGTGKTHALLHIANSLPTEQNCIIYLDVRTIGSNASIYARVDKPLPERALSLFRDVMLQIHDKLLTYVVTYGDKIDLSKAGPLLDALLDSINNSILSGTVETETTTSEKSGAKNSAGFRAVLAQLPRSLPRLVARDPLK